VELENVLEEFRLELSEFYAGAIVGLDGLSIAELTTDGEVDISGVSAEFASVINSISKTSDSIDAGLVQGSLITTDRFNFLTQMIDGFPYFFLIVIGNTGNIGKARYMMNKMVKIVAELIQ
jgi:predicted regulator of Ras-like GTPase activity (Roadblock/LC7/MglB family)